MNVYLRSLTCLFLTLSFAVSAAAQIPRQFEGQNPYMPGLYPSSSDARLGSLMTDYFFGDDAKKSLIMTQLTAWESDPVIGKEALMLRALLTNTGEAKTYGPSVKLLKKCVMLYSDFAGCQVWMGSYTQFGVGVDKDSVEAANYFERAANLGSPAGQWYYGMAYLRGSGRDINPETGFLWIEKSARQDYIPGLNSYAIMKKMGDGTAQNYDHAFMAAARGAKLNDGRSFARMAYMLAKGLGHKKNLYMADIATLRAASKGHSESSKMVDRLLKRLTPQERAEFFAASKAAEPRLNKIIRDAELPQ